jgi:hypothetical protein
MKRRHIERMRPVTTAVLMLVESSKFVIKNCPRKSYRTTHTRNRHVIDGPASHRVKIASIPHEYSKRKQ